ncbi:MAG: hypothetical protein JNK10_00855 [Cyclobacteriaceae bacterium]|nr:hypothetical protein [Cyclobacteriaceae bacterium]
MKSTLIVLLCWLPLGAVCQISNEDLKTISMVRDLERESRPFRSANLGPQVVGDPYYDKNWNPGRITLFREEKTYKLKGIKYDMLNNGLDVMIDNNIKSLDGTLVKSFDYTDSLTSLPHSFVNGKDFIVDGTPLSGFLEVLCWGKLDVYSYTQTTLLRPNYNTAMQSGSENYTISKKKSMLYGPGKELRALNKKELTKIWAEKESEMKEFQKINKLSLGKERDLLLMVDYFNTLGAAEN